MPRFEFPQTTATIAAAAVTIKKDTRIDTFHGKHSLSGNIHAM
jgi:hypothetical protein